MRLSSFLNASLICAIQFTFVSEAWADTVNGLYGGASIGYTTYENLEDEYGQIVDFSDVEVSDTFGYALHWGWKFNDILGVELAYINFGEYKIEETYDGIVDGGREIYEGEETGALEAVGILGRASIPLADRIEAFGRFGVVYWDYSAEGEEVAYDGSGTLIYSATWESLGDGLNDYSPLVTFGVNYLLMDNLDIFGEFIYLPAEKGGWELTTYGLFVGLNYRFSSDFFSKSSSRTREVTACDPKYKDISGIMCEQ